ncbi:phosphatase inhibitor 2 family protein [Candidatus Bathyarchaeota archaeon]|nr:phosphatase inhibitor 2 family protein [Candidatus Bathyarchaeota archaeon]
MASPPNDTGSPPAKRPRGKQTSYPHLAPNTPGTTTANNIPGILKNSSHTSPPPSDKEVTISNTNWNAGNRRTPSASRSTRARTPTAPDGAAAPAEPSQRLKWDEANLYLTEQERTPKMKIDEPKTPFAPAYESPDEDEDAGGDDIPDFELGEPERKVPERRLSDGSSRKAVLVEDGGGEAHAGGEGDSAEEREKHRKFEEMRKRHYEMKGAVQLLGHTEELMEEEEDVEERGVEEAKVPPPMPSIPQQFQANGS